MCDVCCSEADNTAVDQAFYVTLYVTHAGQDHEVNQLLRLGKPLPPKPAPPVQLPPPSEPYADDRSNRFASGDSRRGFGDRSSDDQSENGGRGGFRGTVDKIIIILDWRQNSGPNRRIAQNHRFCISVQ